MGTGIVVFRDENGTKKDESFYYEELIGMRINALDHLTGRNPARRTRRLTQSS